MGELCEETETVLSRLAVGSRSGEVTLTLKMLSTDGEVCAVLASTDPFGVRDLIRALTLAHVQAWPDGFYATQARAREMLAPRVMRGLPS